MHGKVSDAPFFVGVVVVSHDRRKILLAKRIEDGKWTGPGGSAEAEESPKEAVIREAFEEANLMLDASWLEELPRREAKNGKPIIPFLCVLPEMPTEEIHPKNDPDKEVRSWKWHDLKTSIPKPMDENRLGTILAAVEKLQDGLQKGPADGALIAAFGIVFEDLSKAKPALPLGSISKDGKYIKTAQGWRHRNFNKKPHSVEIELERGGKRYTKTVHGIMGSHHHEVLEHVGKVMHKFNLQNPEVKIHRIGVKTPLKKSIEGAGEQYAAAMNFYGDLITGQEKSWQDKMNLYRQFPEPQTIDEERQVEDLVNALMSKSLVETLSKARPALPIGTVRVWAGQKYVKHHDGWVAVTGQHHGKKMGAFTEAASHREFADKYHEGAPVEDTPKEEPKGDVETSGPETRGKEPKSPKEPATPADVAPEPEAETPRQAADRAQNGEDANYVYARESDFGNKGEDLKGSVRHRVNEWKGLAAAEENGTAEALIRRENLLKVDPLKMMDDLTPHSYTAPLAAYLAVKKFPPEPKSRILDAASKAADDKVIVTEWKNSEGQTKFSFGQNAPYGAGWEKVRELNKADWAKKVRQEYFDAFARVRKTAEALSKKEIDPLAVVNGLRAEVKEMIAEARAKDSYSELANMLVPFFNNTLNPSTRGGKGVLKDVGEFMTLGMQKYGVSTPQDLMAHGEMSERAKDVLEGMSIGKAFGQKSEKGTGGKRKFNPAELYIGEVRRKGPEPKNLETKEQQEKMLMDDVGMRGLQWGNSVTDDERKHHLKQVALAFSDLTDVLGLPKEMGSFNGRLGLAIGARGKGTALAHYEPSTKVINLTRKKGVGSLAHEWGHFFDNILGEMHGVTSYRKKSPFLSEGSPKEKTEISAAVEALYKSEGMSDFAKRFYTSEMYRGLTAAERQYWSSREEVFARCFEIFVKHKLSSQGRENTYLSGVSNCPFWPSSEEMSKMAPHFEQIFQSFAKSPMLKKALEYLDLLALNEALKNAASSANL